MHKSLIWIFLVIFFLAGGRDVTLAQQSDEQQNFLEISIHNAKILFNKDQGGRALRLLERLQEQYPRNPEINYLLSILYLKVSKDLGAMKKFYNMAVKYHPSYKFPRSLTEDEIYDLFLPGEMKDVDINLQLIIDKVEKNISRQKWEEARILLKSGKKYTMRVGHFKRNIYNLLGTVIYDHLDSLYTGLRYYRSLDPAAFPDEYEKIYVDLKPRWQRKAASFEKDYQKQRRVTEQIGQLYRDEKYREVLTFIDLVQGYFKSDLEYSSVLKLYRLESLIEIFRTHKARALADSLQYLFTVNTLPVTYQERLDVLETRIVRMETREKIGRQQVRADSLMLRGQYQEGMAIYSALLRQQEEKNISKDFVYFPLARIHKNIGEYDKARDYLNKVREGFIEQQEIVSLSDSINRSKLFEESWELNMKIVNSLMQNNKFSAAHDSVVRLVQSPYLRFGLRDSTYTTLSRIYLRLGKILWAKEMADAALRYATPARRQERQSLLSTINSAFVRNRFSAPPMAASGYSSIRIQYSNTVEFNIHNLEQGDIFATRPPEVPDYRTFTHAATKLPGGRPYLVQFDESVNTRNLYLGAGLLVANGLFFLAR